MYWIILGTTITASFFDSLNPSAVAQQILLQTMVKNKRHVLFFILGMGITNLLMGLAVYYGIAEWISRLFGTLERSYPLPLYLTELTGGILFILLGVRLIIKTKRCAEVSLQEEHAKTPARITRFSLFILGIIFCGVELTSALPYFGFLAMLAGYDLDFPYVLGYTFLYTFIYVLPLILLYFGYNKLRGTALIKKIENLLGKISSYVIPVALSLLGILLAAHSAVSLI